MKRRCRDKPPMRALSPTSSHSFDLLHDLQTDEVDDTVISDNGDGQKVLATVAATVYAFTDKYPEAWIYATGSTKSRTRLYRIGLTNNLDDITEGFELYGQRGGEWQEFVSGIEYEAFLVRRRS